MPERGLEWLTSTVNGGKVRLTIVNANNQRKAFLGARAPERFCHAYAITKCVSLSGEERLLGPPRFLLEVRFKPAAANRCSNA
jgi:hypothetical protein